MGIFMTKVCLPVEEPPITSYPTIANTLSILWPHRDKVLPWLSDHFIQLIIRPNHESAQGDYYDHADIDNFYCMIYGCPFIGWMRNNRTTANFTKLTDYIEYQIEHGYYLEACLDNYYFEFTICYNKTHFIHSTFIHGFDQEKKEVYVSDFFSGKKYSRMVASYDAINKSIEGNDYLLYLYQYQEGKYQFNSTLMNLYLEDYLNAKDSLHKYDFSYQQYNQNILYGLDFYEYLYQNISEENGIIDIRQSHILFDHKKMMKIRLEYLLSLHRYDNEELQKLVLKNDGIIQKTHLLRNMILRYNIYKQVTIKNEILKMCKEIKSMDYNLVSSLLKCTKDR